MQGLRRTKSYIENELDALEKEQEQIDEEARELEKELRSAMKDGKLHVDYNENECTNY